MSKLAHSHQLTMDEFDRQRAIENGDEDLIFRDGDIYFWRWKNGMEPRIMGSIDYCYHCRSCKAIVRNSLLLDTYWSDNSSDRAIDPARVELDYQGNEAELRKINEWETDYYESADIVDMRHANDSRAPVYVKPEAKRSATRISEYLMYKRERNESAIRSAQNDIVRIDKALTRVNEGNLEGHFP